MIQDVWSTDTGCLSPGSFGSRLLLTLFPSVWLSGRHRQRYGVTLVSQWSAWPWHSHLVKRRRHVRTCNCNLKVWLKKKKFMANESIIIVHQTAEVPWGAWFILSPIAAFFIAYKSELYSAWDLAIVWSTAGQVKQAMRKTAINSHIRQNPTFNSEFNKYADSKKRYEPEGWAQAVKWTRGLYWGQQRHF